MTDLMPNPNLAASSVGSKWDYPCLRFSPLLADTHTCGYCKWPEHRHIPNELRPYKGIPLCPEERCSHCEGPLLPDDPRDPDDGTRHRLCHWENDH